jgi:hypothetical protein
MIWMKDSDGNLHEVNWITARVNQSVLGWTKATENEIQAQRRKSSIRSSSPAAANTSDEIAQMVQDATVASLLFDDSSAQSHTPCLPDDHYVSHSNSGLSHSHHSSHDSSYHSSSNYSGGHDCGSSGDFGGGAF